VIFFNLLRFSINIFNTFRLSFILPKFLCSELVVVSTSS